MRTALPSRLLLRLLCCLLPLAASGSAVTCEYACDTSSTTCTRLRRCTPSAALNTSGGDATCVSYASRCEACVPPEVCSPHGSRLLASVAAALKARCRHVPHGTLLVTYTNAHHFQLLLFQARALNIGDHW